LAIKKFAPKLRLFQIAFVFAFLLCKRTLSPTIIGFGLTSNLCKIISRSKVSISNPLIGYIQQLPSQNTVYKLESISSTFFACFFHTNVVSAAFSSYVPALSKISCKKCARKTLMNLTP
jgi:hypothetical protein